MSKIAREIMTSAPQCCSPETTLNEVANLMVQADCGEIPVVDGSNRLIGVITDRDIVCRAVAKGKNPSAMTASECMSEPVVCVSEDTSIDDVMNPRNQLLDVERLRDIVISADIEPSDFVRTLASGGDEYDGASPALPEHSAQVKPVAIGQLDVQQDQIRGKILARPKCIVRRCREPNIKTVNRQVVFEQRGNSAIVLDDQ